MTAYINNKNKVVFIAYFPSDEIKPNEDGKCLFTAGAYDVNAMKYNHVFGKGEEVFPVDGTGLNIGDVYVKPADKTEADKLQSEIEQYESDILAIKRELALEYVMNNPDFEAYIEKKLSEV